MHFERRPDPPAVARRAADLVAELLEEKPEAVLLLPAGGTPGPLYAELRQRIRKGTIDLARAHLFQLDELVGVGRNQAGSFRCLLQEQLLCELSDARDRQHLLDGTAAEPESEIQRHARELAALGGADLALLGIGRNGHVAFNEPGSDLASGARVVPLAETTRKALSSSFPKGPPTEGMTLGLLEIAAARRILLLATGESKREIVAALFEEPAGSQRPASLLLSHPDFRLLADTPAAGLLQATEL